MKTNVFIGYAKADIEEAKRLYDDLKQAGVSPWMDEKHLIPGQQRDLAIRKAIQSNRFYLALMSQKAVKPGEAIRRVNWALKVSEEYPEDDIHIIPVRLEECVLPHEQLEALTTVDMFRDWEEGIRKLIPVIKGIEHVSEPSKFRGDETKYDNNDSSPPGPVKDRWALLVGVNEYDEPSFGTLRFCVKDVTVLAETLENTGYIVKTLHDKAEEKNLLPTRDNIEAELIHISKSAGEDDLLLVYFACHGILVKGEAFLIAQDTRWSLVEKRGFPVAEIERIMKGSKSRRLALLLDACHSGVDIGRDLADPEFIKNVHEKAEGFALLAASTSQQIAQEWKDEEHGVFSYFLLEGLNGKADRNGKGFVTVDDLKNHVLDGLRRWSVQHSGRIQEPTAKIDGLGDMILADFRKGTANPVNIHAKENTDVQNPFGDTGRITDPKRFFDRKELLRRIFEELGKGSNLSLVGETQIGKSSVLSMICALGPKRLGLSKESFVYLSMEWVADENEFYDALCDLSGLQTCRGWKLTRVLSDKRFVVCLDEIEKMTENAFSFDVRSHLRGLADGSDAPLSLVIAGRSPLPHLFPDSPEMTSPLAGICPQMDIGPFSAEDAKAFLLHRLNSTGISFTETEILNLFEETDGHPAKLQRAAHAMLESKRQSIE